MGEGRRERQCYQAGTLEGRKADRISGVRVANYQAAPCLLGVTNGRLGEPNNKIRAGLHPVSLTFLSSLYIKLFWDIKTFFHHIFSNIQGVHRILNTVPQV